MIEKISKIFKQTICSAFHSAIKILGIIHQKKDNFTEKNEGMVIFFIQYSFAETKSFHKKLSRKLSDTIRKLFSLLISIFSIRKSQEIIIKIKLFDKTFLFTDITYIHTLQINIRRMQ